jgi:23S rRNA (adenine2503-C2)-methyltransferase
MQDIKGLNLENLQEVLRDWKEDSFRARQILEWVYKKGVLDFTQMSNLPAGLRGRLKDSFYITSLKLKEKIRSVDFTEKLLFELNDGNLIETVIIPAKSRVSGCLSTQAGCKFACRFCASGLSGFKRDLSAAEIVEQVLYLKQGSAGKLTHLVFMGTGEPLDNYDNLMKAVRVINSPDGLNIGARRITISTVGIIPGIARLAKEGLQFELSVSLHASDDRTRSSLMPVNKKYPLKDLIATCRDYIQRTNRQLTFEYILIKGVNTKAEDALNLNKLLSGLNCKINLILANPVKEYAIEPPEKLGILLFKDALIKRGMKVTLRRSRGQDIQAACGQLRLKYENK